MTAAPLAGIAAIVDLERYPIADLASLAAQSVTDGCHRQLGETGLCLLPEFVRTAALATMAEEARGLAPAAYHTEHWRASVHGDGGPDAGTIPQATRASIAAVAYDRLPADSLLRRLYEWDGLTDFIAAALNGGPLYRCADPLVSCMVTVCRKGDELGWHYDPNDGVVSLQLQNADAGGAFEFAPRIRAAGPEANGPEANDIEFAVIEDRYAALVRPRIAPGTLSLFNGHRSLHRVAPITGTGTRIMALFNYMAVPGYVFSGDIQEKFFGRRA